jgi:hypothetical protein
LTEGKLVNETPHNRQGRRIPPVFCTAFRECRPPNSTVRGYATISIPAWGVSIRLVALHKKHGAVFATMPTVHQIWPDGRENERPVVVFLDDAVRREFSCAVREAIHIFRKTVCEPN